MNKYTIYCTEEQTKKVIELGAPIIKRYCFEDRFIPYPHTAEFVINDDYYAGRRRFRGYATIPTAEQMIGWLEEKGIAIDIHTYFSVGNCIIHHYQFTVTDSTRVFNGEHSSRKEAILAGIDAALNYLIENGK